MEKKKIKLEKETLLRLQDDQMKALLGAEQQTTDSGVACGNTIDFPEETAKLALAEGSCCRRSCNGK
ncbi:class I lanthipeptide [Chitinophaga solisilvae]|uniref:Uncharacterized protein n=1 Tax=Chitinophaga solisilvae TaxID=1233460 RepID=A0A433WG89_9BACT|nr:class I lanthipeptide [Chitinophaga solisilvae]NSL87175.1 hypothetical protein [Chitinophaga solisilvae]